MVGGYLITGVTPGFKFENGLAVRKESGRLAGVASAAKRRYATARERTNGYCVPMTHQNSDSGSFRQRSC
jgi:hypothetical protein